MAYASATGGYGAGTASVIHPNAAHPDAIVVPDAELLVCSDGQANVSMRSRPFLPLAWEDFERAIQRVQVQFG